MKKTRFIAALLVAILALSCFGGFAFAEAGTVLTVALVGGASSANDAVTTAINEKLAKDGMNFSVKIIYLDDYWAKLALEVASGSQIDVAWAHSSTLSGLVAKKVYQPITAAMQEYGKDILANVPEYVLQGGTINGELYAIPRAIPMSCFNNVYNIRKDLREKYGIEKITTIEGLEQYFQALIDNEPEIYPIVEQNLQPLYPYYANYFFPIGDGGANPVYVDVTDGTYTVKSFWDSEAFKNVCNQAYAWAQKGYQPEDTSRIDSSYTGFVYGAVGCVASNIMSASERIDSLVANVPGAEIETVLIAPEEKRIFLAGDNMLAVGATSTHVNEAVSFINWIKANQENFDLMSYGVEGVNYNLVDGAVSTAGISEENTYSTNVWMWNDTRLARFSANYPAADIEELNNWDKDAVVTPFVGFAFDQSAVSSQVSQVRAVMEEYYPNLGKGIISYDEYIGEIMDLMNAAGLQDVISAVQTQVDAWVAAQK